MKLPTELTVMGQKVDIEYIHGLLDEGEEVSGLCIAGYNKIKICTVHNETEEDFLATLGHELVHFVLHKTGVSNIFKTQQDEEAVVVALENNLLPLFGLNKRKWKKKIEVQVGSND